ncbi:MAG TPA: hypothetical protein VFG43_06575 [Geminicoccaceae bacterium]|nr:hypothetical protein [Geminicoccaceae bacterium]
MIVNPTRPEAELVTRQEDGTSRGRMLRAPDDVLELPAIGFGVRLGDLYSDG